MELNKEQLDFVNCDDSKILLLASAGSGKAIPDDTLIPTPNGFKQLRELHVGDYVFDRYGYKTQILGVYPQGEKEVYKVTFFDGREAFCCDEHLWSYWDENDNFVTKELREMIKENGEYKVPVLNQPVHFEHPDCEVNPYILGCYLALGRGHTYGTNENEVFSFKVEHKDIIQTIAEENNFTYIKKPNGYWYFRKGLFKVRLKHLFGKYMKEICFDQIIPIDCFLSTAKYRLRILQGIMDVVGDSFGGFPAAIVGEELGKTIAMLARSLGINCILRDFGRYDDEFIVKFALTEDIYKIFSIKGQVDFWKESSEKYKLMFLGEYIKYSTIVNIEDTGKKAPMTCIYVDNKEHLFLMNDFIVTHNTRCIVERVKRLANQGEDPTKILAITFTNLAAQELSARLEGYPIKIYTVHGYCNYLLRSKGYDTSKYLRDDQFDKLFEEIKKHPDCIEEIDHLLLDEGHDTDLNQFSFIFDIIKPKNWVVVADFKQTIYEWRNACPKYLMKLARNPEVKVMELNNNYRCRENILNYAKRIIRKLGKDYYDNSIPMRYGGIVREVEYSNDMVLKTIGNCDNYKDWFILAKTNDEVALISNLLTKNGIPNTTFKQRNMTLEKLREEMDKNQVIVLTLHSAKGLERPKVMVVGAYFGEDIENYRLNYVAATRAKDLLIWTRPKKKKKVQSWE